MPPTELLEQFSSACLLCGACQEDCPLLGSLERAPGEIAQVVSQGTVDSQLLAAIQRCDLCGRCAQVCPEGLNPAELFRAARQRLVQQGIIAAEDYDVMLVDRDWNFFTIYRDTYGISYAGLERPRYDTLFFPGCTLTAYAPELTRAAYHWLERLGLEVGFSDLCCGKPLDSLGLTDRAGRYMQRLRRAIQSAGARQVITACSNCQAHLQAHLPGVEIHSIYDLMHRQGLRLEGSETLTFHDSCPDRQDPRIPFSVRALLGGYPQVEMASHGQNTICCGSGGIVSMVDPDLCMTRARRRLDELDASGAAVCITTCMACAYRLARANPGGSGQVRHCLEKVLGVTVDYARVEARAHQMWEGEQGERNLQRLAQARVQGQEEA